jgi:hypothetical protein
VTGWTPHWPTVIFSLMLTFGVSFVKGLADQLAHALIQRRKKVSTDADV